MHNENSYTLTFPGLLMFACLVAPAEGGATPVADCRRVLAELPSYELYIVRCAATLVAALLGSGSVRQDGRAGP